MMIETNRSFKQVDFFVIGAPKSGTTAIAQYLSEHPDVFVCEPKEPQYFTFDLPGHRGVTGWLEYMALFPERRDVRGLPLSCDASVWYLYSPMAIKAIRETFPSAKLIAILRRPDEMLPSLFAQQRQTGIETARSFIQAWDLDPLRRKGRKIPIACHTPEFLYYRTLARYGEQLRRVYQEFPRNQVHVILYEDFKDNPKETYLKVLSFLDIENDDRHGFPVINAYADVHFAQAQGAIVWVRQLVRRTRKRIERIFKINILFAIGLTGFLDRWNRVEKRKPYLSKEIRGHIIECYQDDIRNLEVLINRNLSAWRRVD